MALRQIVSLRCFPNLRRFGAVIKGIHSTPTSSQLPQYKTPLSATETDDIAEHLRRILGTENVALSDAVKSQHGQDEGPDKGIPPDIVAFAESVQHVSEVNLEINLTYKRIYFKNKNLIKCIFIPKMSFRFVNFAMILLYL